MIEINLIPNVKRELLKTRAMRNRVISVSFLIGGASIAAVVVLAVILGGQIAAEAVQNSGIKDRNDKLMSVEDLDIHGWKLVDKKTRHNIKKIESQAYCIKDFIRTGIATLKDEVYIVSKDAKGFFKIHDGKRYDLEPDLIKRLYKIPELKGERDLESICRYIIFPYKKEEPPSLAALLPFCLACFPHS